MFGSKFLLDWFMKGSIARKTNRLLGVPTAISLIMGAFVIIIGMLGMQTANRSAQVHAAGNHASEIEDYSGKIQLRTRVLGVESIPGQDKSLLDGLKQIEQATDSLKTKIAALNLAQNQFAAAEQRLRFLGAAIRKDSASTSDISFKALELQEKVRNVRREINQRNAAMVESNIERIDRAILIGVLLMVIALITFASARQAIRRVLVEPIVATRNGLALLTEGKHDFEVVGAGRDDEIGDMAGALEGLKVHSKQFAGMIRSREEQSKAREVERRTHAEMLRELAARFEGTVGGVVGGVASASSQLEATASSMAEASEQSSIQAGAVSSNLGEASQGVTAAAAACDEFAASIGEVSRQAASSANLAREASAAATGADEAMAALTQSAEQIGKIVELISSIAQRTNLLALNASIEAARGGEAGRGFAVVAAEVKNLAAQTAQATDEVAAQIRAIQESTGASSGSLREIVNRIMRLEQTSVAIASAVDQQASASQELAYSIDVAARNTAEVSSNIAQVRETVLAAGAAARQVLSSSQELRSQADVLRGQADEFLGHVRAA